MGSRVYQVSNPNPTLGRHFRRRRVPTAWLLPKAGRLFSREGDPGQGASSRGPILLMVHKSGKKTAWRLGWMYPKANPMNNGRFQLPYQLVVWEFWTINSICWKQSALKKIGVLEKIVPKNFGTQQNVSIFLLHHLARKQKAGLRHAELPPNHLLNDNGTLFCFTFMFKEVPHVPAKERVSLRKTYLCTM